MTTQLPVPNATQNRRKRYLIDKRYQLYYPATWIIMVVLTLLNFTLVHLLLMPNDANRPATLRATIEMVAKVDAALLLLASAWLGFSSILHSHRIAGAMFNINRTISRTLAGDMEAEVRLRKEDFSTEVADRINELIRLVRQYQAAAGGPPPKADVQSPGADEPREA